MFFVGSEVVIFVKKKKKKRMIKKTKTFLTVDFLCCCFCINVSLFSACCTFGVVTGCDSHRARTLSSVKKTNKTKQQKKPRTEPMSQCPKIFLFPKQQFPLTTEEEIKQITLHFDQEFLSFISVRGLERKTKNRFLFFIYD